MATIREAIDVGRKGRHLAVVSTLRADASIQSSVVNAGVLAHPVDQSDVVGFVTYGRTKLSNLRLRPQLSMTFLAGGEWVTVEGRAELIGPDDVHPDFDAEALRLLLRSVFVAAGGTHDAWDAFDRTMVEQRRTAVLISPSRLYSN